MTTAMIADPRNCTDHRLKLRDALADSSLGSVDDVGRALKGLQARNLLSLPLPGAGETAARHDAFLEVAAQDLSLARLVEGHADALAICSEMGHSAANTTYGVWAAETPGHFVHAEVSGDGFRLSGHKPYASGVSSLGRALVTGRTTEGPRLFDVDLLAGGIVPQEDSWLAVGMANSDSRTVLFRDVYIPAANVLGGPDGYVTRRGFWLGATGVAACWLGGAIGCLRMLRRKFESSPPDEHALAHLGAIAAVCRAMTSTLRIAADSIDRDADESEFAAKVRAMEVGAIVEAGCQDVLVRCGRASGTAPLVFDEAHARRAADLMVYLRQHHGERDLALLGRMTMETDAWS